MYLGENRCSRKTYSRRAIAHRAHRGLCTQQRLIGQTAYGHGKHITQSRESGKILKYKITKAGVPLGTYEVGEFMLYPSPHRPLVSKDFQAFEMNK
jgi:hypothetical protein